MKRLFPANCETPALLAGSLAPASFHQELMCGSRKKAPLPASLLRRIRKSIDSHSDTEELTDPVTSNSNMSYACYIFFFIFNISPLSIRFNLHLFDFHSI